MKKDSNIRCFQSRFEITNIFPEDKAFFQWVFGVAEDALPESLPEKTSMQRSIKALLLSGGKIGAAMGVMQ